jgi:phospholipase C
MNAAETVSPSFIQGETINVALAGNGTGSVSSSPAGINCPSQACSAIFPTNTQVSLTETPGTNFYFGGWGGACSGSSSCTLTVSAVEHVTATFTSGSLQTSLNHIIFYAQENRSLDSYFGYLPEYWVNTGVASPPTFNGLPQFMPPANPANTPGNPQCSAPTGQCYTDPNGTPVPSFHMQSICTEELSPFWNESHVDWNDHFSFPNTIDWEDNGFVQAAANDARQYPYGTVNDTNGYRSMGYFTDQDLNFYYALATDFAISDNWFAPIMTRTQMNRAYIYAATSQGHAYPLHQGDAQLTAKPFVEALQEAGISWAIYVETDGTSCGGETGDDLSECLLRGYSYLNQFTYEGTILASAGQNPDLLKNIRPTSQFATDLQNDQTFPQVVLIEPASSYGRDEHPTDSDAEGGVNIQAGAAYVENIVNELMNSPSWKDSAMIFTYDEAGGFFDHVQPQQVPVPDQYTYPIDLQPGDKCEGTNQSSGICSFGMTGYRIPAVVISPFSKKNYVSHTVRDTTAWLNLVEERFGTPQLTARDAYWSTTTPPATMDEFFDFADVPWATPPVLPQQNQNGHCSLAAPNPWGS